MTENAKHTPGPWRIYHNSGYNQGHYNGYLQTDILAGSDLIKIRQSVAGNTFPQLAANARLIAAAPDLLEACKRALAVLEKEPACQIYSAHAQIVRAAIARAKGEI